MKVKLFFPLVNKQQSIAPLPVLPLEEDKINVDMKFPSRKCFFEMFFLVKLSYFYSPAKETALATEPLLPWTKYSDLASRTWRAPYLHNSCSCSNQFKTLPYTDAGWHRLTSWFVTYMKHVQQQKVSSKGSSSPNGRLCQPAWATLGGIISLKSESIPFHTYAVE